MSTPAILAYRNNPEKRRILSESLEKQEVLEAIALIKAQGEGDDAVLNAPDIVSVRLLSQRTARDAAFRLLFEMTLPVPHEEPPVPENFGTEYTVDQFDAPIEEAKTP